MEAVDFDERNIIIAENQEEYKSLPAHIKNDEYKTMITCMQLSFKEKIKILFTGKIWVSELTFGRSVTPRFLSTNKNEVL